MPIVSSDSWELRGVHESFSPECKIRPRDCWMVVRDVVCTVSPDQLLVGHLRRCMYESGELLSYEGVRVHSCRRVESKREYRLRQETELDLWNVTFGRSSVLLFSEQRRGLVRYQGGRVMGSLAMS